MHGEGEHATAPGASDRFVGWLRADEPRYGARMTPSPDLVSALVRLDPGAPAAPDQLEERVDAGPGWNKVDELQALLAAGVRFRILLHGAVGVGKTTELRRWERELGATYLVASEPADLTSREGVRLALVDGLDTQTGTFAWNFGPGSWLIDPANPPLVATVPASFARTSPAERDPGFTAVWYLPPFRVLRRDGQLHAEGLDAVARLLARRLTGLDVLERTGLLHRVALASGGVPRDAIRILRGAVLAALRDGRIGDAHLLRGSREVRQDLEQALRPEDLATLATVRSSGEFRGDGRLVLAGVVLGYEDEGGNRYWRPHPLLDDLLPGSLP